MLSPIYNSTTLINKKPPEKLADNLLAQRTWELFLDIGENVETFPMMYAYTDV